MTEHDLRVAPGRTYRYYPKPTFAFGHGLSLTTWNLAGHAPSCLGQLATSAPEKTCSISLKLKNTGALAGDSVLLAYFRKTGSQEKQWLGGLADRSQKRLMPQLRQLFDFQRLADVAPDGTENIVFNITPSSFAGADEATGDWTLAPGSFTLTFEDGGGASVVLEAKVSG